MSKTIDCFLIGHNQIPFDEYEKSLRRMGIHSGAYRDLDKNTIQYKNKVYSAADIYNKFCADENRGVQPIKQVETFSAGIAYLGTYLHRRGYTFDYVNSFQDEKSYLAEKLGKGVVRTAAILTTFYVTPLPIFEIIGYLRNMDPRVKIIVGGPFISTKYRTGNAEQLEYLFESLGADYYVNSAQGETALTGIVEAVKNGRPPEKIKNIYYKTDNGYVATPRERENNQIAENMVNWELFADRVGEFVNLRTGISCPFNCSFCGFPEHAGKYQTASVEAVERELNSLARIKSVKAVSFVDDTFNIPEQRFKDLLRVMIRNDYTFKWSSFFRCQFADKEMVELMRDSGCENVLLGIESGNNRILENMNKHADVEKYVNGIALLKEAGIMSMGNFFVGFPGETQETVADTVRFIRNTELDFYRVQLWYYEPITPISKEKGKYNLEGESFEWSHKTMTSQQATDLIDQMILEFDEPVRYPQYYFDYDNVFQLPHKGITLRQVKQYLKAFDDGVKEKLRSEARKDVSPEAIERIKDTCRTPVINEITGTIEEPHESSDPGESEYDFF